MSGILTANSIYRYASVAILAAVIMGGILLFVALFLPQALWIRIALACFAISTMCIELRVRMGYRLRRGRLFIAHLSFAIPFFVMMVAYVLYTNLPISGRFVLFFLYTGTLATGGILFKRGYKSRSQISPNSLNTAS